MIVNLWWAALKFFLLPFLLGRCFFLIPTTINCLRRRQRRYVDSWWNCPWYFVGGELFIFFFAIFFRYTNFIDQANFFNFLYTTLINLFYFALICNLLSLFFLRWQVKVTDFLLGLVILAVSTLTYQAWLIKSPQPLNWDYYQHQLLADDIRLNRFSFFINEVSDTFGFLSYPPNFHLNLSLAQGAQQLNSVSIITFWQRASYLHLCLFLLASAALAYSFSGSRKITFLAVLIGALVFDSAVSFTNLFLLPQTFTAVWCILIIASLLQRFRQKQTLSWWFLFLGILFTVLNHFVIGSFAALFFTAIFLYLKFPLLQKKRSRLVLTILISAALIAGIFAARFLDLSFINRGEASSYIFDFSQTMSNLYRFYGLFGLVAVAGGFLVIIFARPKFLSPALRWLLAMILLVATGILFSGFPYAAKFFTLFRFFYDLSLAIFIFWLLHFFRAWSMKIALVVLAAVALFVNLIANFYYWKIDLNYQGYWTHSNFEDEHIADLLWQKYTNQPVLLISDPATQHILEGLSGINSAGGAYGTQANRLLIANLYRSTSIENFLCDLSQISDNLTAPTTQKILAFSGRSFLWFESSLADKLLFNYNVWSPNNLSLNNQYFINSLKKSPRIDAIYESPYLVLLAVDLTDFADCP